MTSSNRSNPILIVEDDRKTSDLICLYVEREGFKAIAAYDGSQALDLARQHNPMFVILDLMLPIIDGWEVCQALRRSSDVPILILTAREEEMDRILGLSLGADDYLVKPFSPRELVARIKAILRRAQLKPLSARDELSHGELTLELEKHKVTLKGQPVSLTLSEYKLLQVLMSAQGKVFSREELLNHLYPAGDAVVDRVVDVHIGKLRQKIEDDASRPKYILTVRGLGYRFAESDG